MLISTYMGSQKIDARVLQILRWSILIQVILLTISSFSPRLVPGENRLDAQIDRWSLASVVVLLLIFACLHIKRIEQTITRSSFLVILYLLAFITIFSRHLFSLNVSRRFLPAPNFTLFRWEAIFFLIIPLVFIAWQYSLREVIVYSVVVMTLESFPNFIQRDEGWLFFAATNILANLARSGIFIIVGWIENRLVTLERQQHELLMLANRKLRDYALTSEKLVQTQERNRLARELHDTLAHTLSGVSVQLEAIRALFDRDPGAARNMLAQTLKNTKNGLAETRRALVDLRSSELEAFGLTQALRNVALATAERGGLTLELHLDKSMDVLPEDISHCLYRSAQEALENSLRHAGASKISLILRAEGSQVVMTIQDDGAGFDPQTIDQEHLGIRGMRERVEMLGGKLNITSAPGEGTQISVRLVRDYD